MDETWYLLFVKVFHISTERQRSDCLGFQVKLPPGPVTILVYSAVRARDTAASLSMFFFGGEGQN